MVETQCLRLYFFNQFAIRELQIVGDISKTYRTREFSKMILLNYENQFSQT